MASETPDKPNPQSMRATLGYEQAKKQEGNKRATVGYGNALWKFQSTRPQPGSPNPEPLPSENPTIPVTSQQLDAVHCAGPKPSDVVTVPAPRQEEAPDEQQVATASTLVAEGNDTLDYFTLAASTSDPTLMARAGLHASYPAAIGEAATVGADSLSGTVTPPTSLPIPSTRSQRLANTTLSRSTVLPHVELVGTETRLVHHDRLRYEHLSQLGEGGVGEVLKAVDNDIGRTVAIKRLKADMRAAPVLVRFMEEIHTVGMLEHPNIVPIHDVGVDESGEYYFVMKYVAGETLESIIEKLAEGDAKYHAAYPFERRMEIFEGIVEALHYAHANGIIHRDIKPANIMVGPYGEVMVMDWGIAKKVRNKQGGPDPREVFPQARVEEETQPTSKGRNQNLFRTREGALIGTPAYMSPEQSRGEPIDERSDIYSLCVLLHELLTLRHYLQDMQSLPTMIAGVTNVVPPALLTSSHPHQPSPSAELHWFVAKGLKKNPAERYQSVAEMIDRLRRRREGLIPIQCHVTFMKRTSNTWGRFIDKHPFVATAVALCSLVAVAGLTYRALF